MNRRFVGVLVFAFVVASGASLLLYRLLVHNSQPAKAAPVSTQIVVATRDIAEGALVQPDDVKLADWPGAMPQGTTIHTDEVIGRAAHDPMHANEPVFVSKLAPKGAGAGLAALIPPGMRAVAIRVNDISGASGFVTTGSRVDVVISGNAPTGDPKLGTLAKTMLQDVEVLSAGQDFKKDNEGKPVAVPVINLLVTPEQAEMLSLASTQTTIQLMLRNPLDKDRAKTPGTALARLFDGGRLRMPSPDQDLAEARLPRVVHTAAPPVYVAPKKVPFVMEIISGTSKKEARFDNGGEAR